MFGQWKHLILEIELSDFLTIFLRFWPFEPHFLINFFLLKKTCKQYSPNDSQLLPTQVALHFVLLYPIIFIIQVYLYGRRKGYCPIEACRPPARKLRTFSWSCICTSNTQSLLLWRRELIQPRLEYSSLHWIPFPSFIPTLFRIYLFALLLCSMYHLNSFPRLPLQILQNTLPRVS